jgi:hypothetical protein
VVVLVVLMFVHAMFLIFIPMLAGAYILYLVANFQQRLFVHSHLRTRGIPVTEVTLLAVGCAIALLVGFGPASQTLNGFPVIQSRLIPDNLVTRMGLQWATLAGLAILFLPLGLSRLPRLVDHKQRFLLSALAFTFVPLILNPVYGLLVAIPILLLIAALGIFPYHVTIDKERRFLSKFGAPFVLAVCSVIVLAPMVVTIPRSSGVPCNEPDLIDSQTYNTGLYLRYSGPANSSFVWDDHIEAERLELISGRPSLEPVLSIGTLTYQWLAVKMDVRLYRDVNLGNFLETGHQLLDAREWLSSAGLDYPYYWGKHTTVLLQNSPDSATAGQILRFYRASYAVKRCGISSTPFFEGLATSNYLVYSDELQRAYWLDGFT